MMDSFKHPYETIDLLDFSNQNVIVHQNIKKFELDKNIQLRVWSSSTKKTIGASPYYLHSEGIIFLDIYSNPVLINDISTFQKKYYLLDQHFARYHYVIRNTILTFFNNISFGKYIQIQFNEKYFSTYFLNAFLRCPQHIAYELTPEKSKDYFVSLSYDEYKKYYDTSISKGSLWVIDKEKDYYLEVKDIFPKLAGDKFIKFFQYLDSRIKYPKETINRISQSNEYMWYYLLSFTLLYRFNHTFINLFSDGSMLEEQNFRQLRQVLQGEDIKDGALRQKIIDCLAIEGEDKEVSFSTELEKIRNHYIRCVEKQKETQEKIESL